MQVLCSIWPCPFKWIFGTWYFLGQRVKRILDDVWDHPLFQFPKCQLFNDLLLVTGFILMCLEDSLPVISRSVNMLFEWFFLNMLFRFTGKGRYHLYWLLCEPCSHSMLRQCQISRMMLPLSQRIVLSLSSSSVETVAVVSPKKLISMFVLYLSIWACSPLFVNSVHYRETSIKSCLPRVKRERTSTWKLNSIGRNMGLQLQNADISALM